MYHWKLVVVSGSSHFSILFVSLFTGCRRYMLPQYICNAYDKQLYNKPCPGVQRCNVSKCSVWSNAADTFGFYCQIRNHENLTEIWLPRLAANPLWRSTRGEMDPLQAVNPCKWNKVLLCLDGPASCCCFLIFFPPTISCREVSPLDERGHYCTDLAPSLRASQWNKWHVKAVLLNIRKQLGQGRGGASWEK